MVFNPQSKTFIKNISLPNWPSGGTFGSMIWDMKFDENGDLWFTDEQSNSVWKYFTQENKFEKYKSPTKDAILHLLLLIQKVGFGLQRYLERNLELLIH